MESVNLHSRYSQLRYIRLFTIISCPLDMRSKCLLHLVQQDSAGKKPQLMFAGPEQRSPVPEINAD